MTRCLLTAATIGTLIGVALTFGPHGAIGVAVCAAGVLLFYEARAVLRDRRRARDKARHPSTVELGRCMDCGQLWSLDSLHRTGGTCTDCTRAKLTVVHWPSNPLLDDYFAESGSPYTLSAAPPEPWCGRHFRYGCCR